MIGRGGGVLDRRHALDSMHGRSRTTIDPRTLTMPGRSLSGFHRTIETIACTKRRERGPATCMTGERGPS